MQDIKVTKDCYIPKENIKLFVAYSSATTKEEVRRMKKENKVYDMTGHKKTLSVIYLKTGELVLADTAVDTLHNRMNLE